MRYHHSEHGTEGQSRSLRYARSIIGLIAAIGCVLLLGAAPVGAQCTTDVDGNDDEPGQKDMSEFCFEGALPGGFSLSWNLDDTQWSGNNTGDACALFDSTSMATPTGRCA